MARHCPACARVQQGMCIYGVSSTQQFNSLDQRVEDSDMALFCVSIYPRATLSQLEVALQYTISVFSLQELMCAIFTDIKVDSAYSLFDCSYKAPNIEESEDIINSLVGALETRLIQHSGASNPYVQFMYR